MPTNKNKKHSLPERIKRFFQKNIWLKLSALALTLLLYYTFSRADKPKKTFSIPVTIESRSGDRVLLSGNKQKIKVTLQGNRIDSIKEQELMIETSVLNAVPTENGLFYDLNISNKDFKKPWDIEINSYEPQKIAVEVDTIKKIELYEDSGKLDAAAADPEQLSDQALISDYIEIELDPKGLPEKYKVEKTTLALVNAAKIIIEGPASQLQELKNKKIKTKPISLAGITTDFECEDLELQWDTQKYPWLTVTPSKVNVKVQIRHAFLEKTFTNIPIRIIDAPGKRKFNCWIESSPTVDIKVSGPKHIVEMLRKEDFTPYIDISAFDTPGRYKIVVLCAENQKKLNSVSIHPNTVTVKLEKISSK